MGTANLMGQSGGIGDAAAGDILKDKTANTAAGYVTGTLELTGDAAVGDVYPGKTFYSNDAKTRLTGTGGTMKKFATGSITSNSSGEVTISGLSFAPSTIVLVIPTSLTSAGFYSVHANDGSGGYLSRYNAGGFNYMPYTTNGNDITFTSVAASTTYTYYAYE